MFALFKGYRCQYFRCRELPIIAPKKLGLRACYAVKITSLSYISLNISIVRPSCHLWTLAQKTPLRFLKDGLTLDIFDQMCKGVRFWQHN